MSAFLSRQMSIIASRSFAGVLVSLLSDIVVSVDC